MPGNGDIDFFSTPITVRLDSMYSFFLVPCPPKAMLGNVSRVLIVLERKYIHWTIEDDLNPVRSTPCLSSGFLHIQKKRMTLKLSDDTYYYADFTRPLFVCTPTSCTFGNKSWMFSYIYITWSVDQKL